MGIKIPFLKNFRRGFATNSSSSHSFVYLKEPVPGAHDDHMVDVDDFSWNDFRLDTIKEKLFYVLAGMIGGGWSSPTETQVEEAYTSYGDEFPELSREDFAAALQTTVDHQSKGLIDVEEARDPRVVVFGGNDNGGESAERASVIRSGLVDWDLSTSDYGDGDNIPRSDKKAWDKFYEQNPWARSEYPPEELEK